MYHLSYIINLLLRIIQIEFPLGEKKDEKGVFL